MCFDFVMLWIGINFCADHCDTSELIAAYDSAVKYLHLILRVLLEGAE